MLLQSGVFFSVYEHNNIRHNLKLLNNLGNYPLRLPCYSAANTSSCQCGMNDKQELGFGFQFCTP